ncbi:MAG: hypothetical protein HPY70_05390 [Firmicutes bacterium]|nr:hypothetical protein [Bacillota bacterium]
MAQNFRENTLRIASMLLCLLLITVSGCVREQNRKQNQEKMSPSAELIRLLPEKIGFTWIYSGFAEYGHEMKLESITPGNAAIRYELNGSVYDASGGEAKGDFSLQVEYEVTEESLIMRKVSEKMMDNFSELELIRLPLREGTQWEQKAVHKDGNEYHLVCTIQKVEVHDEGKVYTVVYKDRDSNFYEKRQLQEGWGVISFETIWQSPEGPFTIGYYLYREASGYPGKTALKAFLPPLGEQLLYFGLAEYAHKGQLVKVSEESG